MMTLRVVNRTEDHPLLASWWKGHGWPSVPAAILPPVGVFALKDDKPIAAGWLYQAVGVGVCWLEWLVSDPKANPKDVYAGLKHVVQFLGEEAVRDDYGVMLTTCRQPSLVRLYEKLGFIKSDDGVTHLIKTLRK